MSKPRSVAAPLALTALTLILVKGFIFKPGEPTGQISLSYGYFLALIASILILIGAFVRSTEIGRTRKPPGVL